MLCETNHVSESAVVRYVCLNFIRVVIRSFHSCNSTLSSSYVISLENTANCRVACDIQSYIQLAYPLK
jgi:hypothetical protein